MTEQELFEAFFTVISNGTGRQITDFFNEQLNKAKENEDEMIFLQKSLDIHKQNKMCYESREIFNSLSKIVREELRKM